MTNPPAETNVSSELWAEALAQYEEDKQMEDRARGRTKRHQIAYESQGIVPSEIRRRYKEAQLSEEERIAQYAMEQISRRALGLFDAETPEDFNRIMERAADTPKATGEGADKLAGVRAYNDGFNGARQGKQTLDDNKHVYGTDLFTQWARGCRDGLDYNELLETGGVPPEEQPEGTILERDEANYRKGTQKRAARKQAAPPPVEEPTAGVFEMPDVPGLPN